MSKLIGADVRVTREETGLSQAEFCQAYMIPYTTLLSWEWERRLPNETSAVYLRLIRSNPAAVARLVLEMQGKRPRRKLLEAA